MNYHYSTLLHLPFILSSETLQASRRDAHGDHDAGLLWFSTNKTMERTALKGSVGAIRYCCAGDEVQPWRDVARSVGFCSGTMRRLEASGRKMGATPSEWRAMVGDLPLARVEQIQFYDGRDWHGLNRNALRVETGLGDAVHLFGPGGLVAVVARRRTSEGYFAYATHSDLYSPDNLVFDRRRSA